jgi:1,4-alpha-glucan branching enzyme
MSGVQHEYSSLLGELDLHLLNRGRHEHAHDLMGAHVREHDGITGTAFIVWAPDAQTVSVIGDFNGWNGGADPMRKVQDGLWELFHPHDLVGQTYKYEIRGPNGNTVQKADPWAQAAEVPPQTASIVTQTKYAWSEQEADWRLKRAAGLPHAKPMSIYEVHLGSWRRNPLENYRSLTYAELAEELSDYVLDMGFTHVELMPVMAHPFEGSWGYQVTSYFAPTPRFGTPDDLRLMIDRFHQKGLGVILDWVPAHFPRDAWALAEFEGRPLYEYADPRRGAHPDWGTLVFDFGRTEVRNFLLDNARYWLTEFHADGLRVDAVASMLYLDYSRKEGEWIPNVHGGRENLEVVSFLKELNEMVHEAEPGVISAAEESTAWPGVSRPTYLGGLGFGFKWNMGWMHDTLGYFQEDPVYRRYHHSELTFSLMYAFSENYILPLSHDETVHGKGSLYTKMAGDNWQKLANLRALYAYMWAHPGKQLLFMGNELAMHEEWNHDASLPWHLLENPEHAGVQSAVRELNRVYKAEPALWELDSDPSGFYWLEGNDAENNVVAFARQNADGQRVVLCLLNLSATVREGYRVGLPRGGSWRELLNTDDSRFGGSGVSNGEQIQAEDVPWHGQLQSAALTLPPLAALWLVPDGS